MGRPLAPCGTYGAYQRHKKRKETVDPACEQAAIAYRQGRKVQAQPLPTDDRPIPVVTCPVCGRPMSAEFPYDEVALRFARIRHLADSEPCARTIMEQERLARIPS
jgi:hypothetical protein